LPLQLADSPPRLPLLLALAQVNQHGTWHRIAAHLGYPADTSHQALRDAPPDTQRISLELARLYQKMLRPFEEIWGKSLVTQQQRILEAQRAGQAVPGMQPQPAPPPPQQQQQPPPPQQQQQQQQQQAPQQPQRPPSQNAASRPGLQQAPSASQLEASRQQLLQQAKAASLAAQQVGAGGAALAAKQQQQQQAQAQQSQQQQLQNGGAAAAAGAGKVNTEPTLEQVAEAKNSVTQIRLSIDQTRRASPFLSASLAPSRSQRADSLPLSCPQPSSSCSRSPTTRSRPSLASRTSSSRTSARSWTRSRSSSP